MMDAMQTFDRIERKIRIITWMVGANVLLTLAALVLLP
jgi:hypothetical protein